MTETPSRIKALLDSVQDVKDEFYVGTAEAYQYVLRRERIYNRPHDIAKAINQTASTSSRLLLPATPERVTGILAALHQSVTQLQDRQAPGGPIISGYVRGYADPASDYVRKFFMENRSSLADFLLWSCNPTDADSGRHWNPVYYFGLAQGDKEYDSVLQSTLANLFEKAAREGVSTEGNMGDFVAKEIREGLQNSALRKAGLVRQRLWNQFESKTGKSVPETFYDLVIQVPWDDDANGPFSRKYYESFRDISLSWNAARHLNLTDRINRLENDRVDHRLEYRRNIVATFIRAWQIDRHGGAGFLEGLDFFKNARRLQWDQDAEGYEVEDLSADALKESREVTDSPESKYLEIVYRLDRELKQNREYLADHEESLEFLKRPSVDWMEGYDADFTYEDDVKVQKEGIRYFTERIKEDSFLRHLLGSEKRFAIKFIAQG